MVPSQDSGQDIQTHTDIVAVKILPCSSYTSVPASAQMFKVLKVLKMKYCLKNVEVWTIKLVIINVIAATKISGDSTTNRHLILH